MPDAETIASIAGLDPLVAIVLMFLVANVGIVALFVRHLRGSQREHAMHFKEEQQAFFAERKREREHTLEMMATARQHSLESLNRVLERCNLAPLK